MPLTQTPPMLRKPHGTPGRKTKEEKQGKPPSAKTLKQQRDAGATRGTPGGAAR